MLRGKPAWSRLRVDLSCTHEALYAHDHQLVARHVAQRRMAEEPNDAPHMELNWKPCGVVPRNGIRVVYSCAKLPNARTRVWVFREEVFELPESKLLADPVDQQRALIQTRFGIAQESCVHEDLGEVLNQLEAPAFA